MANDDGYQLQGLLCGEALEALAEGVMLIGTDGRIEYANRAALGAIGIPRESLIGRMWSDPAWPAFHLDGTPMPAEERPFRRALASRRPVIETDYIIDTPVRGRIALRANAVPVMSGEDVIAVAVSLQDITERLAVDKALRESDERFRAMLEQSRHGISVARPSGETLVYNRGMEAITGFTREDVERTPWPQLVYPDPKEREVALQSAEAALLGQIPYVESEITRKDGGRVWVSLAVTPVTLHGDAYVLAILTDITARKEAERRVGFQSELLNHVRNLVIATDLDGQVTYMNAETERVLDLEHGEAIGKSLLEVALPPSAAEEMSSVLQCVMSTGRWEGETNLQLPDGETRPVMLSLGLLEDDSGPTGLVGVAVDIAELKGAQHALEEKDRAIRQAYVEVVSAVTGGKLVLVTSDEIQDVLGEPETSEQPLRPETLSEARRRVKAELERARMRHTPDEAVLAFGEAATNALKHAEEGCYRLRRRDGLIQVEVHDAGPGIDFRDLPKATLMTGFSTRQSLGMGFTIMLELSDRMLLATEPGSTSVVLEFACETQGQEASEAKGPSAAMMPAEIPR